MSGASASIFQFSFLILNLDVHIPVLLHEVMAILNPQPGKRYIDATINGGGHAGAILERIRPSGKLLGIDWDCVIIARLKAAWPEPLLRSSTLVCSNYTELPTVAAANEFNAVDGILFDLGFSSFHIDQSGRGFSFMRDEPLDMRYNPLSGRATAEEIVNETPIKELERILGEYGQERYARRIAKELIKARSRKRIVSTQDLVQVIMQALPRARRATLHPATRTFQALRIVVNNELEHIGQALRGAYNLLGDEGVLAVIAFHSLEDHIVKQTFRQLAKEKNGILLTKKPLQPTDKEVSSNPRARSAKLRAIKK